jgi:Integrase
VIRKRKAQHFAAITEPSEIAGLLRAIDGYDGDAQGITRTALQLLPLTMVRPGELRLAEWSEFDLEEALWIIPEHRMKMGRDHVVPLSRQAVERLEWLEERTGRRQLAFPSIRSPQRPLSDNTFNAALRRLGYTNDQMTAHGFRAMASTRLNEDEWPSDWIERQLSHVEQSNSRKPYNRAEYLEGRRRMLQAWADYLDALRSAPASAAASLKSRDE